MEMEYRLRKSIRPSTITFGFTEDLSFLINSWHVMQAGEVCDQWNCAPAKCVSVVGFHLGCYSRRIF